MTLSDLILLLAVLVPPAVASIAAADKDALSLLKVLLAGAATGFVIGAIFTFFIWGMSVHVPTSWNLLFGPLLGAGVGLLPAAVVWAVYWLRVRRRSGARAV